MMIASISSNRMERWVQKIAAQSKQPVDWHMGCGRAIVKALGDFDAVQKAIDDNLPELDVLAKESFDANTLVSKYCTFDGARYVRYWPEKQPFRMHFRMRMPRVLQEFTNKWLGIPWKRPA